MRDASATGKVLHLDGGDGGAVDEILVAVGRAPNVEGVGLEAAGVRFDAKKGVEVDDRLRTTNQRIYAAGDVCSRYEFTHAADALARHRDPERAVLGPRRGRAALTIPWCTYTDRPRWPTSGCRVEEATREGRRRRTSSCSSWTGVDRAVLDGETEGFVKVLRRRTGPTGSSAYDRGRARGGDDRRGDAWR